MTLTDEKWIRDYIAGLREYGLEISEEEEERLVNGGVARMIKAFGGEKVERIRRDNL